ncbi:DUF1272 domain-containing protein [Sulfitobacter pseudonitzschiae]|uniref:DUF1272 domain-containing protein n=2 Tax=Pseudosulfitobacter pseudonitzschiae TaxID=1402135 RepID=A0A9Q2RTE1_9RHOB|nr:DUF1272 domain-containing protein [Pseudosulfitobacter pseudonitzschiae]MBM2298232.1 DUF1272 domain-containing protein [Pseudosulfitobacter pseudonitzschiae]MBM2303146.1 DUF1272 domain-containing protein [Pseudosulfitobacter pseudonitzschiae]MBM2312929.1 DUF1272 domain-containing protein [Pseudosulfitobacter pseudonitzschiae]MBM2317842.1 DUF1272 domain-containing protein [Pseudosulfitobacter pseudonitzschiae]
MLELRPNCEMCDVDLPPEAENARICSYECTFCADCVDQHLHNVCPNCGGGFVPRPIRPKGAHRAGTGLGHHPAGTRRRAMSHAPDAVAALSARLRDVPPAER